MQSDRPAAGVVVEGLETTSDKIRALANAGYRRTKIRDYLKVRYQHVRNVMLRAGISGGLSDGRAPYSVAQREKLEKADPVPSWKLLLNSGFVYLDDRKIDNSSELVLGTEIQEQPGVYAFIMDERVVYVGLSQVGLKSRTGHYRRGHPRQKTSARIKKLLLEALNEGKIVRVLIASPGCIEWNSLPVEISPGLEAGLIKLFQPPWNIQGVHGGIKAS